MDLRRKKHELDCPNKKCRRKIEVTYDDLQSDKELECRYCKSGYEIDRGEQSQFRYAMSTLNNELRDMERASKELEKAQDKVGNLSKETELQQFLLLMQQKPNNNSKESVELQI